MTKLNLMVFKNQYKKEEKQPDYKVNMHHEKAGFVSVGAGWIKSTKTGDKYISLSIDTEPNTLLSESEKEAIKKAKEAEAEKAYEDGRTSDGSPVPDFDLHSNHDLV